MNGYPALKTSIILLLGGGRKSTQKADIAKALKSADSIED